MLEQLQADNVTFPIFKYLVFTVQHMFIMMHVGILVLNNAFVRWQCKLEMACIVTLLPVSLLFQSVELIEDVLTAKLYL